MEKVRLGDIVDTIQGSQYPVDEQIYIRKEGYERFLRISDYTKINEPERFVKYTGKELICTEEDVVVVRYGNIGSIGIGKAGILANNLFALKKKGNKDIISKYIYYFLRSKKINNVLVNKANSSTMPALTHKMIKELEIPIYTKELEIKIVKELDKVQEIIDLRKKQIEELDELIKSQFVEMFGNVNDNKNSYEIKTLNEVFEFIKDGTHSTPTYTNDKINGIKFLSAKDVTKGTINWENIKYIPLELHEQLVKRVKPQKGDILLAKNGTTGVCAKVDRDEIFDIYVSLALLRPKEGYVVDYLVQAINNDMTKEQFDRSLKGVGVPNLHLGEIQKVKIIVPPIELQNQFAEIVKQIDKQKFESVMELKKLQKNIFYKWGR